MLRFLPELTGIPYCKSKGVMNYYYNLLYFIKDFLYQTVMKEKVINKAKQRKKI